MFTDVILSFFSVSVCYFLWVIYYNYINTITTPSIETTDISIKQVGSVSTNIYSIIIGIYLILLFSFNYVYIHNTNTSSVFWDSIHVSHNTLTFFYFSIFILSIILCSIVCLKKQNISFNIEYILFIILIMFAAYLLISSTNLFLSIFILEFIALLIFGKFTVSKILFNSSKTNLNKIDFLSQYSYGLFNSLFFQFWANFVSSVFLFFSLINIHYLFGTSNFFLINYLSNLIGSNWYVSESFLTSIFMLFLTGFFIKLGLSPYQFFKIETYKGIPLFLVIIYTTIYLVVYIYFFIYLYFYQIHSIKLFIEFYLVLFVSLSIFYLVSLLFDTKNFKAFLSYSTLITIVNLLFVFLTV